MRELPDRICDLSTCSRRIDVVVPLPIPKIREFPSIYFRQIPAKIADQRWNFLLASCVCTKFDSDRMNNSL
jgi:hypothetical protein